MLVTSSACKFHFINIGTWTCCFASVICEIFSFFMLFNLQFRAWHLCLYFRFKGSSTQTLYAEWGHTTFSWFHCFTSFHNEDYLLIWITARGYLAQLVVFYHIWIGILLGEKFGLYFIVNTYLDESVAFGILHCRYCKHISRTYAFLVHS